jgi:hypothetical protein
MKSSSRPVQRKSQPASTSHRLPRVTLVLGAGVSIGLSRNWNDLTDAVAAKAGVNLGPRSAGEPFPNENQMRLELAWRAIFEKHGGRAKANGRGSIGQRMLKLDRAAEKEWTELLREQVYAPPGGSPSTAADYHALRAGKAGKAGSKPANCPAQSLETIARFLVEAESHRVERVITFNADDWLEFELWRQLQNTGSRFSEHFRVVSQPTFGPDAAFYDSEQPDEPPVDRLPIVHAHGLLCHPKERQHPTYSERVPPKGRQPSFDAPNMLVFRDLDYWRMTATPTSFANHTLLNAMTTSRCVFVGLSFRDLNLLRWAGAIAAEFEDTWRARWAGHFDHGDDPIPLAKQWVRPRPRHVWLTDCAQRPVEDYLGHRDIRVHRVRWGATPPTPGGGLGTILADLAAHRSL